MSKENQVSCTPTETSWNLILVFSSRQEGNTKVLARLHESAGRSTFCHSHPTKYFFVSCHIPYQTGLSKLIKCEHLCILSDEFNKFNTIVEQMFDPNYCLTLK